MLPTVPVPTAALTSVLADSHMHALSLSKRVLTDLAPPSAPTPEVTPFTTEPAPAPAPRPAPQEAMEANAAVARVTYALSDFAALYAITPATGVAQAVSMMSAAQKKNIFGNSVETYEMQSEIGVAGAVHGALAAGALASCYTCSQGLLLTIPTMYRIAGDLLPAVIHTASRSVSTTTSCIFGDYSDVMACRQTGWCLLHSTNVQEAQDMAAIAHLAAWRCSLPFLHFYDGFAVSHSVNKIETLTEDHLRDLTSMPHYQAALRRFRAMSQHPDHPVVRGAIGNAPTHFQGFERNQVFYDDAPAKVQDVMDDFAKVTGRQYHVFDYVGAEDAEDVVVLMGCGSGAIENAVEQLRAKAGAKVGVVRVRLYRPFSQEHLLAALPKTVKRITVLDKVKEPGANAGEPLYLDVQAALTQAQDAGHPAAPKNLERIINGIYGLGGKDFGMPAALAVFANMTLPGDQVRRRFTIGIKDDLTGLNLPLPTPADVAKAGIKTVPEGTREAIFYGIGSDGTVGATQSALKMFAENTDLHTQATSAFEAFKAGGVSISSCRIAPTSLLKCQYPIDQADYLAIHHPMYAAKVNVARQLRADGVVVINAPWTPADAENHLPARFKRQVAEKHGKVYLIDAAAVAQEAGLPPSRISNVLMTVFFRLCEVMPFEKSMDLFKAVIAKSFAKKGQGVIDKNIRAAELATSRITEVQYDAAAWAAAKDDTETSLSPEEEEMLRHSVDPARVISAISAPSASGYVSDAILDATYEAPLAEIRERWLRNVTKPFQAREGGSISVASFLPGGTAPTGTMRSCKRGIATQVPRWHADKCISCMKCVTACSHTALRPVVAASNADLAGRGAPETFATTKAKFGKKYTQLYREARMRIQVSPDDCTSCFACTNVCPAGAFSVRALEEAREEEGVNFQWMESSGIETERGNPALAAARDNDVLPRTSVKGVAMQHAYHGQSGACAGCGLVTTYGLLGRLSGSHLSLANATGCSSVITAPFPNSACSVDENEKGPAWARSLFENAAEFGFGMQEGYVTMRENLQKAVLADLEACRADSEVPTELCDELAAWAGEDYYSFDASRRHTDAILLALENVSSDVIARRPALRTAVELSDHLPRIAAWSVLGDGCANDINSAGVEHALSSGRDFNLLVLDTEQYSNTGGQVSKATPPGVVGQLYMTGKVGFKKDIGAISMTYGNCYVASIAMGFDTEHAAKAIAEAEAFPGPAVVIAYAPCKDHGLPGTPSKVGVSVAGGMDKAQVHQKDAVESGFWPVYTYDPRRTQPLEMRYDPLRDGDDACRERLLKFIDSEGRFAKIKDKTRAAAARSQLVEAYIRGHQLRRAIAGVDAGRFEEAYLSCPK